MNYYRKFIERFSQIAQPLIVLTCKDITFVWGHNYKEAFKKLVYRLTIVPILAIFDLERKTILETDVLDYAVGVYLTQKGDDDKIQIVVFYSRKITGPELNYDIYNKELLAVVEALREWRVYLEGTKYSIQIYIDYKNLLYQTSTKQLNQRQVRQAKTLASYSFKINHVRGTENGRVDALSHRPDYAEELKLEAASIL